MGVCPLCNGLEASTASCPKCERVMEDKGRVMDYFDDYSPYMEIDGMKQIDGYGQTLQLNQCPHLLFCSQCVEDQVVFIQE
ncbi:hypothetical protein [Bacillus pinisoli]|uniref:hypothetical protein n=1 Tax=Bacillus pinisoli TaxID=2901866 RepID=UPI001FF5360C|nr:hypothetical protein [Bacillus pinisoli]